MEHTHTFYIYMPHQKNNIKTNLNGTKKNVHRLSDLQEHILNSPNYFKFTYYDNSSLLVSSGQNLKGYSPELIYFTLCNPSKDDVWSIVTYTHFEKVFSVEEMEFPKVEQKESKKMNVTYTTPIEVMLQNPGVTYIVDDGTGKIAFRINQFVQNKVNEVRELCFYFSDGIYSSTWQKAKNIPSQAYPGSIAEMARIDFHPDAQWLIDVVKSGAEFYAENAIHNVDLDHLKKVLPKGLTITRLNDQIIIK